MIRSTTRYKSHKKIPTTTVVSTFQRKEISRTPERLCSKYVLNVDRETNQTVIFVSFVVKAVILTRRNMYCKNCGKN